jgi:hypothetical protein
VTQHFFEENTDTFLHHDDEDSSFRLGARHAFSPNSILIGNFQYSNTERDQSNRLFFDPADFVFGPPPVEDSTDDQGEDDALSGELSHLYRSKIVDIVSGAGAFIIDRDIDLTDSVYWPGDPPLFYGTFTSRSRLDISHYNLYFYSYIKALENLTLLWASASHSDYKDGGDEDL